MTAPKRRQVQLADDISSELLSTVKLETPEDAVHMASLMDDLTACIFSYGVPCTAGTEHEAIEKGKGLLDEWRAAVESEQGGVEKVCEANTLNPQPFEIGADVAIFGNFFFGDVVRGSARFLSDLI
jgi:hypothetical protein